MYKNLIWGVSYGPLERSCNESDFFRVASFKWPLRPQILKQISTPAPSHEPEVYSGLWSFQKITLLA